jgi:alkylation response protein AidB-like acyl-CoA dehydrogenase
VIDVRPSPPQKLLVATAREYLRRHCPIELVQRLANDPRGHDDTLWRGMAELGWPGLLVPSDFGGSDGSLLDVALLVEELGYALVPSPFVASAVAATTLIARGSSEQRRRWLPPLASGDAIATLALVEDGVSGLDHMATTLASGRLTGRKRFVKDAHVAGHLVVAARGGVAMLAAGAPGVSRVPVDAMSGERLFTVTFDAVAVDGASWFPGHDALAAALEAGALARTAEMVGAAQRVLELTVEHARTRVQGGRPIGGHQAIQHACADMVRDVDAARELLHLAAWRASEGVTAAADIATAKAYAGEACLAVARRAHQIFGAISYCDEHPLHLFHKRMLAASLDYGDAARHLETVARAIGLES